MHNSAKVEEHFYDLEVEELLSKLKELRARRILLQAPDGLKKIVYSIVAKHLRAHGFDVVLSGSGCYGACDVAEKEAEMVSAEVIVHYGHNQYPFYKPAVTTIFVPARYKRIPSPRAIEEAARILRKYEAQRVTLLSTVQHTGTLDYLAEQLEKQGLQPRIGTPRYEVMDKGQVLGCEYSAASDTSADAYVVVSGGTFHGIGLGLFLRASKPIVRVDPYEDRALDLTPKVKSVYARRLYTVLQARDARKWCIIVGSKPGQYRPQVINEVAEILSNAGAEYDVVIAEEVKRSTLDNLEMYDAFVITSCPRLATDDFLDYWRPVLAPGEVKAVVGDVDDYRFPF